MNVHTLSPSFPIASHWTLRSQEGTAELPWIWLGWSRQNWRTEWSLRTTKLQFIGHASSAWCTTAVRLGDFTQHKSDDIDLFIFAEMHLFICWFERGTNDLVLIPACYPTFMFSSNSTGSACLGMDTVYRMCAFRMPFCQENSPPARGNEDDLVFALKTSPKGTWIRWTWLSRGVSRSPTTTHAGNAIYTRGCREETRNIGLPLAVTVLDGEKSPWQYAFDAIETVITMWNCKVIANNAPPSATEV